MVGYSWAWIIIKWSLSLTQIFLIYPEIITQEIASYKCKVSHHVIMNMNLHGSRKGNHEIKL